MDYRPVIATHHGPQPMGFYRQLLRITPHRPMQAAAALYWHVTGRRVRAGNTLLREAARLPFAYRLWIDTVEAARPAPDHVCGPKITVIAAIPATGDYASRLVAAMRQQAYAWWELVFEGPGATAAAAAAGDPRVRTRSAAPVISPQAQDPAPVRTYVWPLPVGAIPARHALSRFVEAIAAHPKAAVYYGDHDVLGPKRTAPWLKPRWNYDLFLVQDYISQACLVDCTQWPDLDQQDSENIQAALLALAAPGAAFVHVPHVLAHLPNQSDPATGNEPRRSLVQQHLRKQDGALELTASGDPFVRWPLQHPAPAVTIVIPTRDKADLLETCLSSLLSRTAYPSFEVLVVDNGSTEPETLALLRDQARDGRVAVISDDRPYNFAQLNNYAVSRTRTPYVCFLNNDTEIIDGNWLEAMMRHACRHDVGAVGAKLLYSDGSIQHAGVVLGMGQAAGHAHRFLPEGDDGYFRRAHLTQEISAVTAACLVVSRDRFDSVGGFDEVDFPIAFNDVDLCCKLSDAGWRNIYVAEARLIHHESKSRGNDLAPDHRERYGRELARLQAKWGTQTYVDPRHHPDLDRNSETYLLRFQSWLG